MYSKEQRKLMLGIARSAIKNRFQTNGPQKKTAASAENFLKEKRGVFVTLTIGGRLRGCIGNIEPVYPLYRGITENALSAAFRDPRFTPLRADELENVKIEVSVLTVPGKLEYDGATDLTAKLVPGKDGVIVGKGFRKATYLPQVWESLPDKEAFLSSLCVKAGLDPDEWIKGKLDVETYEAEAFEE